MIFFSCHFLCLDAKKVTKEKSRRGPNSGCTSLPAAGEDFGPAFLVLFCRSKKERKIPRLLEAST
jgi:hypothetical protein